MENITNWNINPNVAFGNYIDLSTIQQEGR